MSENTYPSVNDLTLEEKASLTSGGDAWHLQGVEAKGIPGYMITDGPHGLRKSNSATTGEVDLNNSVPATCFPPAAGLSSSWNPELIHQVGEAMAEECIQEKVAVILGPGVNIKRNPLGGRCFEYWSEDPYLAGHEAVGIVAGVQSKGVGTSLKHFAANSQETDRLRISANISQRALREIYFPAFEHIVKEAQPWTIMCAYNCINGVHAAQDRWLLTDVLRDEWGFQGIVMSDWGADHDRVASLNAGLNLEMPPSYTDDQIVYAARDGRIQPAQLDRMAQGMIDLVSKTRAAMSVENYRFDIEAHDEVAHQAAVESMVLLKNDDAILPVAGDAKVTVIGEENVPKDQAVLYVANHRSYFDILLTYSRCPIRTGYVAKKEMERYPLLSNWMRNLYCLFLDREDIKQGLKTILQAADYVKSGISVCIFPEGTRNKNADETDMLPFHDGSFKIATRAKSPIIPVAISNSANIWEANFPKMSPTHVVIEYGKPIIPSELDRDTQRHLGAYTQNIIKEMLIKNKELV